MDNGPMVQSQLAAQLGGAFGAHQAEIVLHAHGNGPALAAGPAASSHFAGKSYRVFSDALESLFVSYATDGQRIGVPAFSSSLSCLTWSISPWILGWNP